VNNKHIEFYRCLALTYGYDFQIRDFIVSIEECIKRDKLRPEEDRVGEEVIRKLAKIAGNKGYPSEPIYRQYKE
jgi:predicted kinase